MDISPESIILENTTLVDDSAYAVLVDNCRRVEEIDFNRKGGITDIGSQSLRKIASGCPSVTRFSISGAFNLTDDDIEHFTRSWNNMVVFEIKSELPR